jgi:GT2 family glycosyltransferase
MSDSPVHSPDILPIPRRQWLGRLMERFQWLPAIARIQRVRRKRFLTHIKSPGRRVLVQEILLHECAREFQSALKEWTRTTARSIFWPEPLDGRNLSPCRCSVIINTVDRADDLALTLDSLREKWNEVEDEIIIVLGPTGDNSEEIIRRSAVPCRLIHFPVRNLAVSRNLGWLAANGRHVAFIDDDASPAEGWLDALLEPLERDSGIGISAGFVMDGQGERFLNRFVVADTLGRAFWFDDEVAARAKIDEMGAHRAFLTATGCNMAFRRSVLETIGGFDPFYQYFLEETDVVWRALAEGFRCEISPNSHVLHRLGLNLARTPSFELENRIVVIRSQIHYIGKFGKSTFSSEEIENCLWERALLDLEKIAWDSSADRKSAASCAELQSRYLHAVANEFRLDTGTGSSSFRPPNPIETNPL